MADIRKREGPNGRAYQVRWTDSAGKPRYKTFRKRGDAVSYVEQLDRRRTEAELGRLGAGHGVGDALDNWLRVCTEVGRHGREPVEASTRRMYDLHVRTLKALKVGRGGDDAAELGGRSLHALTGPDCAAVRQQLLRDMSRESAAKVLKSFRAALAQACEDGMLAINPAAELRIVSSGRAEATEDLRIPTREEMRRILEAAEASRTWSTGQRSDGNVRAAWRRYHPMLLLLVFGGLRPSEMRGASWSQLDLDTGALDIRQRADEKGVLGPPKTKAGRRTIYLPPATIAALEAWRSRCPKSEADLVFPTGKGHVESLGNIHQRMWRPLQVRAGVVDADGGPRFDLYSCRHFYASMRIAAEAKRRGSVEQIAMLLRRDMGHSSINVTLNIYGHLFPRDVETDRANAADLEAVLFTRGAADAAE